MSFLYKITIYPLEVFYKYLYLFFVNVSGSYFWSLVFLSIFTTLLFIPIRRFTTKIQNKQKLLNSILEPQLKLINEKYIGEEKHRQVTALYKRYAYHPIYSLRSSLGVLIQVPFLIATYYMILDCDLLFYEPFYFINDLSKPDKLLFGINVLPFVMTFFNIVAGYFLLNMSRKEHVQLYFIAGLFLLLLYSSPSALLIYWTFNNFFTLILNFISFWQNLTETDKALFKNKVNSFFKENILFIFLFICLIVLSFVAYFGEEEKYIVLKLDSLIRYHKYFILALFFTFLISLYPFIQIFKNKSKDNGYILQVGTVFIVVGYFLYLLSYFFISSYELTIAPVMQNEEALLLIQDNIKEVIAPEKITVQILKSYIYVFACFSVLTIYLCSKNNFKLKINKLLFNDSKSLYCLSVFFIILFFSIYTPLNLYISDKAFYSNNIFPILKYILFFSLLLFCLFFVFWFIVPKKHKDKASFLSFSLALLMVLYSVIFMPDTGALFGGVFLKEYNLETLPARIGDIFAILIVLYACALISHYQIIKRTLFFLKIVILVLLVVNIYYVSTESLKTYKKFYKETKMLSNNKDINSFENLPPEHQDLFSFSKDGKNVLVIILDSFTGSHVGYLEEEFSEIFSNYKGFTWYADTVTLGQLTAVGIPSIYGGENYWPSRINERDGYLIDKISESFAVIPRNFSEKDFNVKFLDYGVKYNEKKFEKLTGKAENTIILWPAYSNYSDDILKNYKQLEKVEFQLIPNTFLINLYTVMPSFVKFIIYDEGKWKGTNENVSILEKIKDISIFYNIDKYINNNAKKSTVKYIYSSFTHYPWVLDKDFTLNFANNSSALKFLNDDSSLKMQENFFEGDEEKKLGSQLIKPKEYYYSEMHALNILNDLFFKMQNLGIYDNTLIILTSDHGFMDFPKMPVNAGARSSGLFLVKEIGATGEIKNVYDKFMQTSDTAAIVCEVIGGCDGVPLLPEDLSKNRIRYNYAGPTVITNTRFKKYYPLVEFVNQGPIYEAESWGKIKEKKDD